MLFIDLHGYDQAPVHPSQALDALLRALAVPGEHIPPTVEERAGLYRSRLVHINDPVLVIADNASAEAQVRPLLPGAGRHKVLVTSRHTLAGLGARLVDVTVLDEEAAVHLLDAALLLARPDDNRIRNDRQAARRLAEMCGELPLALQIVAALLNADPGTSTAELSVDLSEERDRLAQLIYHDGSGDQALSVAAAFELSYRRLPDIQAQLFRLLSVNPGPDVSIAAAAVLVDLPVPQTRKALKALGRAHMIERTSDGGRWQMHGLLRLYASRLSEAPREADIREQARDRLLNYYSTKAVAVNKHLKARRDTSSVAPSGLEDVLAWLDAERANLVASVSMAADTGRDQVAMELSSSLTSYLDSRGRFDDFLATAAIALEAARRLGDRPSEGKAQTILGLALFRLRRFEETISAFRGAAAIYKETGERNDYCQALLNLGNALTVAQQLDEAITVYNEAAAFYRTTGARDHENRVPNSLGVALSMAGRYDEAIAALREAAAFYRKTGDQDGEAAALDGLGDALRKAGRFDEAIDACKEAASISRETATGTSRPPR